MYIVCTATHTESIESSLLRLFAHKILTNVHPLCRNVCTSICTSPGTRVILWTLAATHLMYFCIVSHGNRQRGSKWWPLTVVGELTFDLLQQLFGIQAVHVFLPLLGQDPVQAGRFYGQTWHSSSLLSGGTSDTEDQSLSFPRGSTLMRLTNFKQHLLTLCDMAAGQEGISGTMQRKNRGRDKINPFYELMNFFKCE